MTNQTSNENINNISRRKFLRGGAVLSAAVGLSSLTGGKASEEVAKAMGKKELDKFPHEIAPDFQRYDKKRWTIIRGMGFDPEFAKEMASISEPEPDKKKPGYTTLDYAIDAGATVVDGDFGGGHGFQINSPMNTWEGIPGEHKYEFGSKEDASIAIKKAAKFYGADLVGICAYDERWVFDPMWTADFDPVEHKMLPRDVYDTEFPFKPKSVIVMAIEMDYEAMSTAPSLLERAACSLAYSKMGEINHKLATFIRALGYNAFGAGNEVAESVPYGILAGLGEQGRQGLLITYEYGPRVRLCKIFTEMDLAYDKPIEFGANKFCQVCKKCAENCPSQSISLQDEMTWDGETPSVSNHTGVKKYYVNLETCYQYWKIVGNDCGVCIASCPFNKPDFWHHRISTALTATPLKPFLNEMDDLFGYGNIFDDKASIDFWSFESYTK